MRTAIVGTRYVGLVNGVCFAEFGHDVTCIDTAGVRLHAIRAGVMPFYEPGLSEVVERHMHSGRRFPKDTRALAALGATTDVVLGAISANERQRRLVLDKIERAAGSLRGATVAVLRLAFKPNTSDVREAAGWYLCRELIAAGAHVRAFDPAAMSEAMRALGEAGVQLECAADAYAAIEGADVLVIATEWNEFRGLDLARVRKTMRGTALVDARNVLDPDAARAAGVAYTGVESGDRYAAAQVA